MKTKSILHFRGRYWMITFIQLACMLGLSLPWVAYVSPPSPWPEQCQVGSLPGDDPCYPADQLILTCLPENWNGQLIVYAHGYVPVQEPLALPLEELTLPNGRTVPEILVPLGYAFATSSYHKNGYAVEQAGDDLNALVEYFKSEVAPRPVEKVLLAGASEGGLITTMLVERYPETYDAGLALCGPIGGAPYQIRYLGDFRVVFDYFFPGIFSFGVKDVPQEAFEAWDDTYVPSITDAILSDPNATDQLFGVTKAARDPSDPASVVTTAIGVLYYNIWGSNDSIDVAGGWPYGNQSRVYRGSADDVALNLGVERVKSDSAALTYMFQFYQPTGTLQRPLVTLHITHDEQVPFRHEWIYLTLVTRADRNTFLPILPVARYAHCAFTTRELLVAFARLVLESDGFVHPDLEKYLPSLPDPLR